MLILCVDSLAVLFAAFAFYRCFTRRISGKAASALSTAIGAIGVFFIDFDLVRATTGISFAAGALMLLGAFVAMLAQKQSQPEALKFQEIQLRRGIQRRP